jgi:hypothetical protein
MPFIQIPSYDLNPLIMNWSRLFRSLSIRFHCTDVLLIVDPVELLALDSPSDLLSILIFLFHNYRTYSRFSWRFSSEILDILASHSLPCAYRTSLVNSRISCLCCFSSVESISFAHNPSQ